MKINGGHGVPESGSFSRELISCKTSQTVFARKCAFTARLWRVYDDGGRLEISQDKHRGCGYRSCIVISGVIVRKRQISGLSTWHFIGERELSFCPLFAVKIIKHFLAISTNTATREQSFFRWRCLKSWLRTTMHRQCLSSLAVV